MVEVVLDELAAVVVLVVVVFKLLNTDDAVLVTADVFKLTETEALAVEVEDEESSSEVAVEE